MTIIQSVARDPSQNFGFSSNLLASSLLYFLNPQFTKEQAQHKDNESIANHLPTASSLLFKYKIISSRSIPNFSCVHTFLYRKKFF